MAQLDGACIRPGQAFIVHFVIEKDKNSPRSYQYCWAGWSLFLLLTVSFVFFGL